MRREASSGLSMVGDRLEWKNRRLGALQVRAVCDDSVITRCNLRGRIGRAVAVSSSFLEETKRLWLVIAQDLSIRLRVRPSFGVTSTSGGRLVSARGDPKPETEPEPFNLRSQGASDASTPEWLTRSSQLLQI